MVLADLDGYDSIQNWQAGARRTERFRSVKSCVGVFGNLLRRFEIMIVRVVVIVLAIVGRIITTDLWTRFINSAAVIFLQMATNRVHQQVPRFIFNKHRCLFVKHIPSDIFEVRESSGRVDWQGKISAAFGGTMFTQILASRQIFAFHPGLWRSVHFL